MTSPNREIPAGSYGPRSSGLSSLSSITQESAMAAIRQPVLDAFGMSRGSFFEYIAQGAREVIRGIADALMALLDPAGAPPVGYDSITFAAGEVFKPVQSAIDRLDAEFAQAQEDYASAKASSEEVAKRLEDSLNELKGQLAEASAAMIDAEKLEAALSSHWEEKIKVVNAEIAKAVDSLDPLADEVSRLSAELTSTQKQADDAVKALNTLTTETLPGLTSRVKTAEDAVSAAQGTADNAAATAGSASGAAQTALDNMMRASQVSHTLAPYIPGTTRPAWSEGMTVVSGGYQTVAESSNTKAAAESAHVTVDDAVNYKMDIEYTTPAGQTGDVYVYVQSPAQNGSETASVVSRQVNRTVTDKGVSTTYTALSRPQFNATGGVKRAASVEFQLAAGTDLARVGRIVAPVGTVIHKLVVSPAIRQADVDKAQNDALDALSKFATAQTDINEVQKVFNGEVSKFVSFQSNWNVLVDSFAKKQAEWNKGMTDWSDATSKFMAGQQELNKQNKTFAAAITEHMQMQGEFNQKQLTLRQIQDKTNQTFRAMFEASAERDAFQDSMIAAVDEKSNLARDYAQLAFMRNNASLYVKKTSTGFGPKITNKARVNYTELRGDAVGVTTPVFNGGNVIRLGQEGVWDIDIRLCLSAHNLCPSGLGADVAVSVFDEGNVLKGRVIQRRTGPQMLEYHIPMSIPASAAGWSIAVEVEITASATGWKYYRALITGPNYTDARIRQVSGNPRSVGLETDSSWDASDLGYEQGVGDAPLDPGMGSGGEGSLDPGTGGSGGGWLGSS